MILAAPALAQDRPVPYWASIQSGEAMMRTGPARTYPGMWLYKRRDLPVRVLKRHENWRLIEDSEGTRGWMLRTMLSDTRTALIKGGSPRQVHAEGRPEAAESAIWPSRASSAASTIAARAGATSASAIAKDTSGSPTCGASSPTRASTNL
jgi:SH3-like domain-containing protein